tara:strand:- start:226 stop:726 length:501 start_codon:yes stop_codon:yes gene_type:complete
MHIKDLKIIYKKMSLSTLNQDPIACISVFLNALEIKNIHCTNTYLKNCVHEKNEKNKQKKAFIMGGLHSMEHAPLQYFMLNKSFDQFLCMLYSGLFHNELTKIPEYPGWDLLASASKHLSYEDFKVLIQFFKNNNLFINMKTLNYTVLFRRPSEDKTNIKLYLKQI